MRVAVLSDIHGNLPALDAVLGEVDAAGIETIVVGGDVAAGPLPRETVQRLIALGPRARYVRGNADREVVAAFDARAAGDDASGSAAFAAARLGAEHREFLAGFHDTVALDDVDGLGAVVVGHGSPRSDMEIITTATPDERLAAILRDVPQRTVVGGHTHRQQDRRVAGHRYVNAGSVGAPYEGRAGAYWAILGPDVELRRTEYDVAAAVETLRAGGYPNLDEDFRESLLDPLDPDEVATFFEGLVETTETG